MYRQKKYDLGKFLEVEIFRMPEQAKPFSRAKRIKESTPAQKKLNNKKAIKYLNRLVHKNFDEEDLTVELTFDEKHLPQAGADAHRIIKNYIARLRRFRRRNGLPELKYIAVISDCDELGNKKRLHAHMFISGMDRDTVEKLWKCGWCNTDRIQFNEYGAAGKVHYMARQSKGAKLWFASRNLDKPEAVVSDKAITRAKAEHMERDPEDRAFFEKLYPGWTFTDCIVEHMDDEGLKRGTSFLIRMRKA